MWRREDAEVEGTAIPRTDDCEPFLEPKWEDTEVESDDVEPFPRVYPLSELGVELFLNTLRTLFSASDEAPDDPIDGGALVEGPLEKTRWSFVGGPVRGRCIGVVERSAGVGS